MKKSELIEVVKEIRKRSEHYFNQNVFCREHNFLLEALKFEALEKESRQIAQLLENKFDLGYVSIDPLKINSK